jgi:hypothetical protein
MGLLNPNLLLQNVVTYVYFVTTLVCSQCQADGCHLFLY